MKLGPNGELIRAFKRGEYMNKVVELGDEVECKVTKFKGIVVTYAKCLTGCDRLIVQPPIGKDGKHPDSLWVDAAAVTIIKKGKVKPASVQEQGPQARMGGPSQIVKRRGI